MNASQPFTWSGATPVSDRPEIFAARRLDLFLREADAFQLRARQRIQRQHEAAGAFEFLGVGDQAAAGTADQQRNPARERGGFPKPAPRAGKISAT